MKHTIRTDVGAVRAENQDRAAVFVGKRATMAILCDGMGGHFGGSFASSITVDTFAKEFSNREPSEDTADKWFTDTVSKSVKAMTLKAQESEALMDMGTTLTMAIIFEKIIFIYNIGDSRTYVYDGLLNQMTVDQNLRNHYIEKFGYSEDEASQIVGAAALISALGPTKKTIIKKSLLDVSKSVKYVILTSDGIHDYITKPVFEQILASDDSLEMKTEMLIKWAIKSRSSDNLTCVIVDFERYE